MKNFKINALLLGLFFGFSLVSCDDNDVDQNYGALAAKPVATLTYDKVNLTESDDIATALELENVASFTLTASQAYKTDMKFKVEFIPTESTGSFDDFEIDLDETVLDNGTTGFLLTIPKFSTTAVFSITSIFDVLPEGNETFKFRVYPVADLNGSLDASSQEFTLTIGNSISNNLVINFDWNGDAEYRGEDGEFHSYSDNDFDIEIYNSSFSIVADSYNDSPEEIVFVAADYPDGLYYIVPSFWEKSSDAPMLPINFPATLSVAKQGVFVYNFDMSGIWNSTAGGDQDGNPDAYQLPAYFTKTTVSGVVTYELFDANDDSSLASGRMANFKSIIASKKKLRK